MGVYARDCWWWSSGGKCIRDWALQATLAASTALIFTALDCWDWGLGCLYSLFDAWLHNDVHLGKMSDRARICDSNENAAADHVDQFGGVSERRLSTSKLTRSGGVAGGVHLVSSGTRGPQSVCVCARLVDTGRSRRLRAIQAGKWHKCSCWGWELDPDCRQPPVPPGRVTHDEEVVGPQVHSPAAIDPLAGSPYSDPTSAAIFEQAQHGPPLVKGRAAPGCSPALREDSVPHLQSAGAASGPGHQLPRIPLKETRNRKKKRVYVGRWTDCQCSHCTDLRSQSHRQLYVQYIGRDASSRSTCDVAPGSASPVQNDTWTMGGSNERGEGPAEQGHVGLRISKVTPSMSQDSCVAPPSSRPGPGGMSGGSHITAGREDKSIPVGGDPPDSSAASGGAKADLILLHGYSASSNFWSDTLFPHLPPALLTSRRVFAPDLLGTGRSPRPQDCHFTLKDHVEALEASVLARHGVQSFHIVGHSLGSLLAVILAARHLRRVLSVTLLAPVYAPDMAAPHTAPCEALLRAWAPGQAERWGSLPGVLWQRVLSSILRWYFNVARFNSHVLYSRHQWLERAAPRVLPPHLPASFVRDFLRDSWDVQLHMFNNTLLGGAHALDPAYQALAAAGVRILVDHGTRDGTCPLAGSAALARRYANVELRRCEGADHLHVVLGREREVVLQLREEIARAEHENRQARASARRQAAAQG